MEATPLIGFDSKAKDRSFEATWIERSGSAAEAAKPRPRPRGALRKRVLRNARERVEEEEEEVVGSSESEVGDVAEAIFTGREIGEREMEGERLECRDIFKWTGRLRLVVVLGDNTLIVEER